MATTQLYEAPATAPTSDHVHAQRSTLSEQ